MPRINSYSFGRIVIDGKTYMSDVIIFSDRVKADWWRKEGHELNSEDITEIIEEKPDLLIVGKGAYGLMKIKEETKRILEENNIKLIAKKTSEACKIFNEKSGKEKVVAALHLTC